MQKPNPNKVIESLKTLGFTIVSFEPANGHARLKVGGEYVGTIEPRDDGKRGMKVSFELNGTPSSRVLQEAVKQGYVTV